MRITQSLLSWRSFNGKNIQSPLRFRARAFLPSAAAILTLLLSTATSSFAGSATWNTSPGSGDWNTATNWNPATVPNSSADTATFQSSNVTSVSTSANTEVNGIVFNAGASAFTITASPTVTLTISGVGITNNSGITQNFVTANNGDGGGIIIFSNTATAGSLTAFTNSGGTVLFGGTVFFEGTSTAGNGTFTNNGALVSGAFSGETAFFGSSSNSFATAGNGTFTNNGALVSGAFPGKTDFEGTSTAGNGTFTNNGGAVSGAGGGFMLFRNTSTAGSGTFTNNGGAVSGAFGGGTEFLGLTAGSGTFTTNGGAVSGAGGGRMVFSGSRRTFATAGNATLIANGGLGGGEGGLILFLGKSHGGTARVEVFGTGTGDTTNGNLDISFHKAPGVATGSIEGTGAVFLGANNLTVGTNNLSTTFSGVIQDGGQNGGTGGSLTKTGNGKLKLTTANTYTGGTTVSKGTLLVKNKSGSATGSGAVQVNSGTLGGTGTIAGAVTIATGASSSFLAPGIGTKPGILTLQSTLTFNSAGTYKVDLNSSSVTADEVVANGVTINSGAQFSFADHGTGTLTPGTVFTVISNTAATPIAGTFSNLADGSTFTSNGNNFKVNYEGGTGNDLTLTVQ